MKLLLTLLLMLSISAQAKVYECLIESDEESGSVKVSVQKKKANVLLHHDAKKTTYKNCQSNRDEFGLLIDCNNSEIDFMILINDEIAPASGGIMSNTHSLFVDLEC